MPIVRGSWYSQLPPFGWFDRGDKPGSNALGVPDAQQGIATPGRSDLGKWFNVTPPGEKIPYPMQKTDVGPAPWTGRGVDISAAGAHQMGYTPQNFPTDAAFKIEPRDEPRGLGSPAGMPVQAGELPDNTDATAGPIGPRQEGGRRMPDSLMDMFQPTDPMGKPTGWNDAIAQRSNSLIGLGLGLLSPIQPGSGETGMTQGLRGLMAGSQADTRNAEHRQQIARQAAQDAFQRSQAAQAQSNWEKQFARDPEALRIMRATGIDPSSPEGRGILFPKTDEWKAGSVTYREQEYPYRANLRTGQYEWGPLGPPPGIGGAARPAAPYTGGAAVPFVSGGGAPSSAGVLPSVAPSTTGAGGTTTQPGAIPPPLPGIEEELPSVQKAIRTKQLEDFSKTQVKDPQQEAAAKQSAYNVMTAIDTAEKQAVNKGGFLPTTGVFGGKLTQVYQPAADLDASLKTIAANVSLDKLTAMRAASPTGASGLGAVTEGEHALLQASIAAVSQSQSQDQLLANLKRVRATYDWIVNRTDKNQPPPFSLRPDASQPATTGGAGGAGAGGRTFIRDPSGRIVPQ